MTTNTYKSVPWVNIHTHLNSEKSKDIIEIHNLFPEEFKKMDQHPFVSMGLHPWYLNEWNYKLRLLENHIGIIQAVGEIGLDKACKTPIDLQMEVFEEQLELAKKHSKPVVIHCVKAYSEIIRIKKHKYQDQVWILHGFNAGKKIAEQLYNAGCYFSFGKFIMIDGTKARSSFDMLPLDRIFFENDEQECLSIEKVYNMGATLKGVDMEVLKERIYSNFTSLFNIK